MNLHIPNTKVARCRRLFRSVPPRLNYAQYLAVAVLATCQPSAEAQYQNAMNRVETRYLALDDSVAGTGTTAQLELKQASFVREIMTSDGADTLWGSPIPVVRPNGSLHLYYPADRGNGLRAYRVGYNETPVAASSGVPLNGDTGSKSWVIYTDPYLPDDQRFLQSSKGLGTPGATIEQTKSIYLSTSLNGMTFNHPNGPLLMNPFPAPASPLHPNRKYHVNDGSGSIARDTSRGSGFDHFRFFNRQHLDMWTDDPSYHWQSWRYETARRAIHGKGAVHESDLLSAAAWEAANDEWYTAADPFDYSDTSDPSIYTPGVVHYFNNHVAAPNMFRHLEHQQSGYRDIVNDNEVFINRSHFSAGDDVIIQVPPTDHGMLMGPVRCRFWLKTSSGNVDDLEFRITDPSGKSFEFRDVFDTEVIGQWMQVVLTLADVDPGDGNWRFQFRDLDLSNNLSGKDHRIGAIRMNYPLFTQVSFPIITVENGDGIYPTWAVSPGGNRHLHFHDAEHSYIPLADMPEQGFVDPNVPKTTENWQGMIWGSGPSVYKPSEHSIHLFAGYTPFRHKDLRTLGHLYPGNTFAEYKIREDGFAAYVSNAGNSTDVVWETTAIQLPTVMDNQSLELRLNAKTGTDGLIQVEVFDADTGNPFAQYSLDDTLGLGSQKDVFLDDEDLFLWDGMGNNLSLLQGQNVGFRFVMRGAVEMFSFRVEPTENQRPRPVRWIK